MKNFLALFEKIVEGTVVSDLLSPGRIRNSASKKFVLVGSQR